MYLDNLDNVFETWKDLVKRRLESLLNLCLESLWPDFLELKTVENEVIPAVHLKNKRSTPFLSEAPLTILYSHGNAEALCLRD